MKPLTHQTCRGNWGTLLLPINADDSIDYGRLEMEIDALIAAEVDGIYSNGTAGEFHTQTEAEFDQISQLLAEKCNAADMPFQIGASHSVPAIMLSRIERTRSLSPSAYQVILPDWVTLTEKETNVFFHKVAAIADPVPMVLYNPHHAKKVLTPHQYTTLKEALPALISIKLLDGDASWYGAMQALSQEIAVFVPGHHLATGVAKGLASGAYSNVACIHPQAAQRWWDLMHQDIEEALEIEKMIQSFFDAYIVPYGREGYSNPALDKLLAAVGKWAPVGTRLRWPYQWIPESEVQLVRAGAQKMLPAWFFAT